MPMSIWWITVVQSKKRVSTWMLKIVVKSLSMKVLWPLDIEGINSLVLRTLRDGFSQLEFWGNNRTVLCQGRALADEEP
jgi:hypothetical protein